MAPPSSSPKITITPLTYPYIPAAARVIQLAFDADPYNNWAFDKRPGKFDWERNLASLRVKCEWGIERALFYVAKIEGKDGDEVVGISMWSPPSSTDTTQSWRDWYYDRLLWWKQGLNRIYYRGHGGLITRRYWEWKAQQARAQARIWGNADSEAQFEAYQHGPDVGHPAKDSSGAGDAGYYFVNVIAVHPEYQGLGIGRKLMAPGLERADEEGRRCYLESSRWEPNTPVYGRMGFKCVLGMRCEDDPYYDVEGNVTSPKGSAKGTTGKRKECCDLFCMVREPGAGPVPMEEQFRHLDEQS